MCLAAAVTEPAAPPAVSLVTKLLPPGIKPHRSDLSLGTCVLSPVHSCLYWMVVLLLGVT